MNSPDNAVELDALTVARKNVTEVLIKLHAAYEADRTERIAAGETDLERSAKVMRSIPERFGGPGATIGTLSLEQCNTLIGYYSAEDRSKQAALQEIGVIPDAHHSCTDLANANRLQKAYGKTLVSVRGCFRSWTGTHWERDNGEAHRYAAELSAIVGREAKQAAAEYEKLGQESYHLEVLAAHHPRKHKLEASPEGARILKAHKSAKALAAWAGQCEMKNRQDAALGLLRNMLTLDPAKLDADPWLLNCLSGTIDLRTGALKPHDPKDYITRCCPVKFNPNATAPAFERFVKEIVDGDELVVDFLRRWFGYCATGSVREHKLMVHIGPGSNGKSTLVELIGQILGNYAATAPSSLIADNGRGGDRHPTEIMTLRGRRMVTAAEADDTAVLREAHIKNLTGGDTLTARGMREDFQEFAPTHKLQLHTNHRPIIKGQDHGIWRRILLVTYPIKFGTPEEIASGEAIRLKDGDLPDRLQTELEGVLAWVVRGAVEWRKVGLMPPDSVLAAGAEYKEEQDRVGNFVSERCVLEPTAWAPFGGSGGLYPTYTSWCKENGFNPLSMQKFVQELPHAVPGFAKKMRKVPDASGTRRSVKGAIGLRLEGYETEFPPESDPPTPPPPAPTAPRPTKRRAEKVVPPVEAVTEPPAPTAPSDAQDTTWLEVPPIVEPDSSVTQLMAKLGSSDSVAVLKRIVGAGYSALDEIANANAASLYDIPDCDELTVDFLQKLAATTLTESQVV